jgi:hypothetical protein
MKSPEWATNVRSFVNIERPDRGKVVEALFRTVNTRFDAAEGAFVALSGDVPCEDAQRPTLEVLKSDPEQTSESTRAGVRLGAST